MVDHSLQKIRPWGVRPTPLVSAVLRTALGGVRAPDIFCSLAGKQLGVRDLGVEFWEYAEVVDHGLLRSLVTLVGSRIHRVNRVNVNLRAGERRIAINELPLSARARNSLCRRYGAGRLPPRATIQELLLIPNFGVRCLLEFTSVVEAAQLCEPSRQAPALPTDQTVAKLAPDVSRFIQHLSAWAAGEQQLDKLCLALPEPRTEWPSEIQLLWQCLGRSDTRTLAGGLVHNYSVPALLSQWINSLDKRQIEILNARTFPIGKPKTLEQIGEQQGITRERIRQIEKKTIKHLELLRTAEYRPSLRRARKLRAELGSALPENDRHFEDALTCVVADFEPNDSRNVAQQILLWLAGPYRTRNGWVIADSNIVNKSKSALLSYKTDRALISGADAQLALNELGIREMHHRAWIDRLNLFQRVDEGLLHFTGSILDKAEQLLRYLNRPITADELVVLIGSSSVRSVRQRLITDPRFWRINKQNQFVLAGTEGYDEYTGIVDELIQELEACGGSASVEHLVKKITKTYGVQPTSVLAYLNTPAFVRNESGLLRVRDNEVVTITTDIEKTAGCYRMSTKWVWRVKVDQQMMRGSGRMLPNAFARELGCKLGDKMEVHSAFGKVTVSWSERSATGAALGSIRAVLEELGAEAGDYVFLIAHDRHIGFRLLRQEQLEKESSLGKLARLVGVFSPTNSDGVLRQIADALMVAHQSSGPLEQHIRDALLSRGEAELCDLIGIPKMSMDQYLDRIGSVLGAVNSNG